MEVKIKNQIQEKEKFAEAFKSVARVAKRVGKDIAYRTTELSKDFIGGLAINRGFDLFVGSFAATLASGYFAIAGANVVPIEISVPIFAAGVTINPIALHLTYKELEKRREAEFH